MVTKSDAAHLHKLRVLFLASHLCEAWATGKARDAQSSFPHQGYDGFQPKKTFKVLRMLAQ